MKKASLKKQITDLQFVRIGEINIKSNSISFAILHSLKMKKGNVYLFVTEEKIERPNKIIYIGMTEKIISERLDAHQKGYVNTTRGKEVAIILKKILKKYIVGVYCRHSTTREVLKVKGISYCSIEEIALIKKFSLTQCLINGKKFKDYKYTST
jgi:hypothetical protein